MTTVVFLHGTGARAETLSATLAQIESSLTKRREDIVLHSCLWGDAHGSQLFADGASFPKADGPRDVLTPEAENLDVALWAQLQDDPLFELCLLGIEVAAAQPAAFHPTQMPTGRIIEARLGAVSASTELATLFDAVGLGDERLGTCEDVMNSIPFHQIADSGTVQPDDAWPVIIRAVVACALRRAESAGRAPQITYSADARNAFVQRIHEIVGADYRSGVGNWAKKRAAHFVAQRVTSSVAKRRHALSDAAYPFAGDVLLYQRDGTHIRAFVREAITQMAPPVVLLAHSLGGIIAVDLLATENLPVDLLVTVGTTAPLLYELDALFGLRAGESLPDHFPEWINIYDRHDFLAYVGAGLFADRIRDVRISSKQPFPRCHSAYWWTDATWEAVLSTCP